MSDEPLQGRRSSDHQGRRRLDLDVRGVLAVLSLIGVFTLAFVQLLGNRGTADVPAWATTVVGAVIGFYFGGRTGNGR